MFYILTRVWVLHTPNAGPNIHFQCFFCYKGAKKVQKSKKFAEKYNKKMGILKFAPKRWSKVLFPEKKQSGRHVLQIGPGRHVYENLTTTQYDLGPRKSPILPNSTFKQVHQLRTTLLFDKYFILIITIIISYLIL